MESVQPTVAGGMCCSFWVAVYTRTLARRHTRRVDANAIQTRGSALGALVAFDGLFVIIFCIFLYLCEDCMLYATPRKLAIYWGSLCLSMSLYL